MFRLFLVDKKIPTHAKRESGYKITAYGINGAPLLRQKSLPSALFPLFSLSIQKKTVSLQAILR
jgi:hypothetical protein